MTRPALFLGAAVLCGCAWIAACSASSPRATGGGGGEGGATSGGGSDGSSVGGGFATASTGGGSTGIGGGCAGTSVKAEPIPLDIFVMLDQSGSMLQGAGNGETRWDTVKAAIGMFVQDPATAGIGMGIQYFGLPEPSVPGCALFPCASDADCTGGCTSCAPQGVCQAPYNPDIDSCNPVDYAWAEVPIQPLPGVANAIVASMGAHAPGTNTPTSPALEGAILYAKTWREAHPTHVTVVAFATDGGPSECDTNLDNINAIAAAGVGGVPSVRTFVIGVGPMLEALDGIAAAGGTTAAFHVDLNATATEQLVDAMNTIRLAAIGCTYQIPPPPMDMQLDFALVNVEYTPGDGGPPQTIPKVGGPLQCPAGGDGWYYDDEAAPAQIILCASTCDAVSEDLMAEIDVVLGCQTVGR